MLLDKRGYFKQRPPDYRGNILTALDEAFNKALENSRMFLALQINTVFPADVTNKNNAYSLVTKTDHVSFLFNGKGLEVKIRGYGIVLKTPNFSGDPVYFRVYLSEERGGFFGNPIKEYYKTIYRLIDNVMGDLSSADFDNDEYTSIITQVDML